MQGEGGKRNRLTCLGANRAKPRVGAPTAAGVLKTPACLAPSEPVLRSRMLARLDAPMAKELANGGKNCCEDVGNEERVLESMHRGAMSNSRREP